MKRSLVTGTVALLLGACNGNTNEPWMKPAMLGDTPVLATTADLRLVMARPKPPQLTGAASSVAATTQGGTPVTSDPTYNICAEPSPDVAKALSSALTANANATAEGLKALGAAGASVSVTGGLADTHNAALAELGRRLATTQMLRDGLFNLCEAYSNGAITKGEYALVLSRYGDTMVTLLAIEALSGMSTNQKGATATSIATATAPASGTGGTDNGNAGKGGAAAPKGASGAAPGNAASGVGATTSSANGAMSSNAAIQQFLQQIGFTGGDSAAMIRAAAAPGAAASAPTAVSAAQQGGAPNKKANQKKTTTKKATTADAASGASGTATTDAPPPTNDNAAIAGAIVNLQKAYLEQSKYAPLIVFCSMELSKDGEGSGDLYDACKDFIVIAKQKLMPSAASGTQATN